jgi:hypothetical protein
MHSRYTNGAAQTQATQLAPNLHAINAHLHALFLPDFVHKHPFSWIEIAYARPGQSLNKGRIFPAHDLKVVVDFVTKVNAVGFNVYVGAALRHGKHPSSGRANKAHFLAARYSWIEYDAADDHQRVVAICKAQRLEPAIMVVTGTIPHQRCHLYFLNAQPIAESAELEAANTALRDLFDSDDVQNCDRVLRIAGTINYPSPAKVALGYATELTSLLTKRDPARYTAAALYALRQASAAERCPFLAYAEQHRGGRGKSDDELLALLEATRAANNWHNNMRAATASMVGKGWPEKAIMFACAAYAKGGIDDKDVQKLVNDAVAKFGKRSETQS